MFNFLIKTQMIFNYNYAFVIKIKLLCINFKKVSLEIIIKSEMKKTKNSQQKPILPISLSSKKNQTSPYKTIEGLFTPYKLDWKNPSARVPNINLDKPAPLRESNQQSRSFFKTMKSQLSNIKNDVERLIKKDIGMDEQTIRNNIMNSNSNKKNDSPIANQRNKKCSSFSYNQNMEISSLKNKTQANNFKETKHKKSNQILLEIDPKQEQKLTLLQKKMFSLESQNQQIIKKLLLLQDKFSNKAIKTNQSQEKICNEIKRMMPEMIPIKTEQLSVSFQNRDSDRIMQILQSKIQMCESIVQRNSQKLMNSQSMISASKQTQKLQEKIQMFESEMERLQAIILDLEKRNKEFEQQKEAVFNELRQQKQKSRKINNCLNQQKNHYERAMCQIRKLEQTINSLQTKLNQNSKSTQSVSNESDNKNVGLAEQNQKIKSQIIVIQGSYKQLIDKFEQSRRQLDKYKVKQNYYATELAKERQKNKNSSTCTQQKDDIIKQLRATIEATLKQKNEIVVQWESEVSYYKTQLQQAKAANQTDNHANYQHQKQLEEMQQYVNKLQLQIQQRVSSHEMIANQQQNYILNLEKQIEQSEKIRNQLLQKNQQTTGCIEELKKELINVKNEKASQNAKSLGKEFQDKINEAYDEIYSLKRKLTYSQNKLHQLSVQKKSLDQALNLYQQRDRQQQQTRNNKGGYKADQYDNMARKIEELSNQNEQLKQKYDMAMMKMENQIDTLREKTKSVNGKQIDGQKSVNGMLKQQLQETGTLRMQLKQKQEQIYKLKGQIKEKVEKIHILSDKLSIANLQKLSVEQSLKQSRSSYSSNGLQLLQKDVSSGLSITIQSQLQLIKKKQESTEKILEVKARQLKMKDEFITNALIGKINKKESDDQIHYLIKQLERITKKHFFH